MVKMERRKTDRGFGRIEFADRYGVECSIQDSSLATEDAIWLGCNDSNPRIINPHGPGWIPYLIPEGVHCNTRMHLTREHVRALLPILQSFVQTGLLPTD